MSSIVNASPDWTCQATSYGGHQVRLCTLPGVSRLSAIFMRILDERAPNVPNRPISLGQLWQLSPDSPFTPLARTILTADSSSTYTRPQLFQVIRDILRDYAPTRILAMDSALIYDHDNEHHDHVASGMFTLAAAQAEGNVGGFEIYRNYSTPTSPANLTTAQYNEKVALMATYGDVVDTSVANDSYNLWCQRQYSTASITLGPGTLRLASGECLGVVENAVDGASVTLSGCTGRAGETWSVRADAQVVGASGLCLNVESDNSSILLRTCADTRQQKWTLFDNRQLRGFEGTCLTASGTDVSVADCDPGPGTTVGGVPEQKWIR